MRIQTLISQYEGKKVRFQTWQKNKGRYILEFWLLHLIFLTQFINSNLNFFNLRKQTVTLESVFFFFFRILPLLDYLDLYITVKVFSGFSPAFNLTFSSIMFLFMSGFYTF